MAKAFSPMKLSDGINVLAEDLSPGAPSFVVPPSYMGGNISGVAKLNPNDFNGGPLSGTNELHFFGAFYADDGTNPLDNLGGQQASDAGLEKLVIAVTEAQAASGEDIPFSFPVTPAANHAMYLIGMSTSDDNG